eukprot:499351-Pelagomonas_calceolata.AAC.3
MKFCKTASTQLCASVHASAPNTFLHLHMLLALRGQATFWQLQQAQFSMQNDFPLLPKTCTSQPQGACVAAAAAAAAAGHIYSPLIRAGAQHRPLQGGLWQPPPTYWRADTAGAGAAHPAIDVLLHCVLWRKASFGDGAAHGCGHGGLHASRASILAVRRGETPLS